MTTELATIEQQDVAFYDDQIIAVRTEQGIFIPIRPICDLLGIAFNGQRERINRDEILSEVTAVVRVTRTTDGATDVQTNEMTAIPIDFLNGWLFGISARRVKPEVKERVLRYQRECHRVLADAFRNGELLTDDLSDVAAIDPAAVEALETAQAVVKLAKSHVRLIRQAAINENRLGSAEKAIVHNLTRLDAIEAELGNPARLVSQPQQMDVTQAVKAVAYELGQRSGRNEFGGVYGELYRRFEVTSYKLIPAAKHGEAMAFLSDWYSKITGTELPF